MNELLQILKQDDAWCLANTARVLATVTRVSGSSYRRPGARMLISESGEICGCVSGGCLERDLLRRARRVLAENKATLLTYDTHEDSDEDSEAREPVSSAGLGCEGEIEIWLEPIGPGKRHPALEQMKKIGTGTERGVLLLFTKDNWMQGTSAGEYRFLKFEKTRDFSSADLPETLRPLVQTALERSCNFGLEEVLVESLVPIPQLYVFGAGYDAIAMTELASDSGYQVTVVDCRSSLPLPRRAFEKAHRLIKGTPESVLSELSFGPEVALLLMTHHAEHDLDLFTQLIQKPFAYLGILGPRKRGRLFYEQLKKLKITLPEGVGEKIYSPVGLDLGGDSPQDIALSAIAQISAVLRGRSGRSLRDFDGPIHEREAAQ